jgi:hypothetical protein
MRQETYQRGISGEKYGIWNCQSKEFQFGISEDTPMLAVARLHQIFLVDMFPVAFCASLSLSKHKLQ